MNNRTTDQVNRNPITRRSALGTALFAVVAAGAASVLPTQTEAQSAAPSIIVNGEDLTAECQRLFKDSRAADARWSALYDKLVATLDAGQRDLLRSVSDAATDMATMNMEWEVTELARHFPGFAPAILMVWNHAISVAYQSPGACCTMAEGFEP